MTIRPIVSACLLLALVFVGSTARAEGELQAGMGIMVGEVTSDSALVQLRLTLSDKLVDGDVPGGKGFVTFHLRPADRDGVEVGYTTAAREKNDFIARAQFKRLQAGTEYKCRTKIVSVRDDETVRTVDGPTATFKTLPGAKTAASTRFVVVTGMNYAKFHGDDRIDRKQHLEENNTELPKPYAGKDKQLGYPALETIRKLKPDFFIGTGDNVYYDTPDNPRAKTIAEMRQKWHEQFVQPRYRELFAVVPTYWEIDDHDYRVDDGDNSGDYDPSPELAQRVMLEQLPFKLKQLPDGAIADAERKTERTDDLNRLLGLSDTPSLPRGDDDEKTYRTHRVSKDLQIWLVENRIYRSPNKMKDGPKKTIWGEEQREWLKRTLEESDATFKLLISPNPMIGPDDARKTDNHTNIGGFQHERDEFFAWLKKQGLDQQNFYVVCGDRHWQYHSIHPTGIEEFSCGALVDANSRLGRAPGDPKSTDPDGKIKQVYAQEKPSGGFLLIEVEPAEDEKPATLNFLFNDERGKLLYKHTKQGEARR